MIKLVDDAKQAWKWLSVQLAVVAGIALELYEQFPQFQQWLPDKAFHRTMTVLVLLIIVGRLIQQGKKDAQPPAQ